LHNRVHHTLKRRVIVHT